MQENVWQAQQESIRVWGAILLTIGTIVVASSVLLYRLGAHARQLEQALIQSETKRLADVSKLVLGIAHELRNPLNAVRLNLFTTEKLFAGNSKLPVQDAVDMIHESVREVERVDELIGQLLGYAQIDSASLGTCSIDDQVRSILTFLRQAHEQNAIVIDYIPPGKAVVVRMDGKALRQVLLNVIKNACEATGLGGTIAIRVEESNSFAMLRVDDSGPGIQADQYEKIFEPFYSTRAGGVGLGLAVVRSMIKRAGGSIVCSGSRTLGGMSFQIQLPIASLNDTH